MQKSYTDAVLQEKLNPAGAPKIETEDEDANGFTYVATLEVMPEVKLQNLDKIRITKPVVTIDQSDLDAMIEKLRAQKATWVAVDRKSKDGDRVVCDFTGLLKGEPIAGGEGKNVPVVLGEGQMLPDFEKGLTGVKGGDDTSFKVKFPKDYHAEDLQGQKVDFTVHVQRVEEINLPVVDDAFAESFNVAEGGIERFRADVRENMEREAEQKVRADIREQVMEGLLDTHELEIPKTLKHQEMHSMQHEAMRRMGVEDHSQAPPLANFAEAAEKRVRLGLLLRQLINDEKLILDRDRLRAHIEEMCAGYESADEMVEMYLNNPEIVQRVEPMALEQVAVDWLLEHGEATEKKVSFTEYMNS